MKEIKRVPIFLKHSVVPYHTTHARTIVILFVLLICVGFFVSYITYFDISDIFSCVACFVIHAYFTVLFGNLAFIAASVLINSASVARVYPV